MPIDTTNLRFYHGTDSRSALSIISFGYKDVLPERGANKLAAELCTRLTKLRSELVLTRMLGPRGANVLAALRSLSVSSTEGLFCYGDCYTSPNPAVAYGYAVANRFRSEWLLMISEAMDALRDISLADAERIASNYPSVIRRINEQPGHPVVIELLGIEAHRLRTERGSPDIDASMQLFFDTEYDYERPHVSSFRIADVTPRDIVAVHDLSGWVVDDLPSPSYLSTARIKRVRMTVTDWLSRHAGGSAEHALMANMSV
jgi:hypothetical protein